MTETIVLRTRCGCFRRDIVTDIGDLYRVALAPKETIIGRRRPSDEEKPELRRTEIRLFRYDGERSLVGRHRIFREVAQ